MLESSLPPYSFGSMDSIIPTWLNLFDRFTMITSEELIKIVSVMNKTTCLSDPFPSKLLMSHLPTIIDKFQSAYRCGHSTETALLRVYNDIVTMVGMGNGSYLVLLDLSAAFDTIDHDTLFVILEKYVGITGSAL